MKDIFDECQFGEFKLNSRIIRTGLWESQNRQHGYLKPEVFLRYERLSKNDVGLIISELISLYPNDKFSEYSHSINYPLFLKDFKYLTDICHESDVPVFAQIAFANCNVNGKQMVGVNDLTLDDIRQIQSDYLIAARNISFAGFDGIQLNIGNNYFLSKVIDAGENKRTDNYGGSLENRLRMIIELIQAIKKITPLHINCRFNANSQNKDETLEIARLLEKYGADSLQITKPSSPQFFTGDCNERNILFDITDMISKNVDIPVILGGGLSDMGDINNLINKTDIDFVSMQRPFVCNPTFLHEWREKGEGKSKCSKCNNCYWKKTSTCHMVSADKE